MKGRFSLSLSSFHSAPSLFDISELCIFGFSWAIFRRCPRDHTINAFIGRLICSLWSVFDDISTVILIYDLQLFSINSFYKFNSYLLSISFFHISLSINNFFLHYSCPSSLLNEYRSWQILYTAPFYNFRSRGRQSQQFPHAQRRLDFSLQITIPIKILATKLCCLKLSSTFSFNLLMNLRARIFLFLHSPPLTGFQNSHERCSSNLIVVPAATHREIHSSMLYEYVSLRPTPWILSIRSVLVRFN